MATIKTNIQEVFDSFAGKQILIIGDVMIDAYIWGSVDRISPEAPVPVVAVQKREHRLGGAANVALNIRNLGGIPILCSITGDDEKGMLFTELLREQDLPENGIIKSDQRKTTVKFRVIGNNAQMLRVDEESSHLLTHDETSRLLQIIHEIILSNAIGAIVFEDYDKGVITPELISQVVDMAGKSNIPIAVDPKKNHFLAYEHVHLFKPNLKELREGLKIDHDLSDLRALKMATRELHEKLHIGMVMVTLSDKGIFLSRIMGEDMYEEWLIPAHTRSIADVSGAGDTVIGTAAMCLASHVAADLMAALCNLAGGLVCEYVGVVPVDKNKLFEEARKYLT
jgi:D-glycero-beta-D-manno-heptose-7-phosphate kinase